MNNILEQKPILVSTLDCCRYRDLLTLTLTTNKEQVKIEGDHAEYIALFLKFCTGHSTVSDILAECNLEEYIGYQVANLCFEEGWVIDSCELFKQFHVWSSNPTMFSRNVKFEDIVKIPQQSNVQYENKCGYSGSPKIPTTLQIALESRESCRSFNSSLSITSQQLFSILVCMTQLNSNKCVPSAGGMYSVEVFCILLREIDGIPAGVYLFNSSTCMLHSWEQISNSQFLTTDWIERLISSKAFVAEASVILLLASNVQKVSMKYSNRAFRYCFIEAGHMLQNAAIYCTLENLGCVEIGGFDDQVASLILADNDLLPQVSLVVGVPSQVKKEGQEYVSETFTYSDAYVGDDKIVRGTRTLELEYKDYRTPLISVVAYYSVNGKTSDEFKAFGKSTLLSEAYIKAVAEAVERSFSMNMWWDTKVTVNLVLNPQKIWAYHKTVYQDPNLIRFESLESCESLKFTRQLSGEMVLVPADITFYGFNQSEVERPILGYSSSTGVAAHSSREKAFQSALLELIERDALSLLWYCQRDVSRIPEFEWPTSVSIRSNCWKKYGFDTHVLDITVDSVCVVLVLIVNQDAHPCLSSGCSASFTYAESIYKAFNEAELMLLTWQDEEISFTVDESQVNKPEDYGAFYMNPCNLCHINWLLESTERSVRNFPKHDWQTLYEKYDPIWCELSVASEPGPISVVRVISETLLPLNFSYGHEPYNHPRPKQLGLTWVRSYPSIPHFFS